MIGGKIGVSDQEKTTSNLFSRSIRNWWAGKEADEMVEIQRSVMPDRSVFQRVRSAANGRGR